MSCYGCGSAEGNAAKLCPACNEKRNASHNQTIARLSQSSDDEPVPQLTQHQKILLGVGSALLLLGLAFLFSPGANQQSASSGPKVVPTLTPIEGAFQGCVAKTLGPIDVAEDPEAADQARQTCEAFKSPCTLSATSAECTAFITEHSPKQATTP